jgi:hypothetical protein
MGLAQLWRFVQVETVGLGLPAVWPILARGLVSAQPRLPVIRSRRKLNRNCGQRERHSATNSDAVEE